MAEWPLCRRLVSRFAKGSYWGSAFGCREGVCVGGVFIEVGLIVLLSLTLAIRGLIRL